MMSTSKALLRGRFPGGGGVVDLLVRGGRVVSIVPAGAGAPDIGSGDALLAPGLLDMQVNGACGHDLQRPDLNADVVHGLNACLNAQGVLYWIPTLVTDSMDALEHKCRVLAEALRDKGLARHVPGIHLEGPHISPEDGPRGAHPAMHVLPPSVTLFNRLQRAAEGRILYVTLAPELPGAMRFIRAVVAQGVVVALGHHAADGEQIHAAADAGARLCTHLGNGMAPRIHRHANGLWPQLADDRLAASIIADLEHVPPDVLKVMVRAKGPRRVALVSDSVALAGMPAGRYEMFGASVELRSSGRICLAGTELLAGSSLLLPDAVGNVINAGALTEAQAFAAATRIPARLLGARLPAWPPRPGRIAELVVYAEPGRMKATQVIQPEA